MVEEEHKEHADFQHAGEGKEKAGGITSSFKQHKTLWIVGGVGAAGVLLLLFMNSSGSGSTPAASDTSGQINTQGGGGAVDTSSLVGTGGVPSWYNPGTAENLDYWPYVPVSGTSSDGSKSSSGSSSSKSGSKSSSGSSKSKSSGSSSKSGSKSSSGGVSHGTSHGVSSGHKTTTNKNKVTPNPKGGGAAHGHVITSSGNQTLVQLQQKYFPSSNGSNKQGNIMQYGNNSKLLKQYAKTGQYNPKTGAIKAGTKLNV